MTLPLSFAPKVEAALTAGAPVVALESTIISHGLPWPDNLHLAQALEAAIVDEGAVPATIGLRAGRIVIGLDADDLTHFARSDRITKVSRRDLATVLASRGDGATTVAGTMICAAQAGIRVFATGGIGGVHRGAETSFDISADLLELAQSPVAVVCSGAKSILDLPKTLEVLETHGVPVLGYGTDAFPAFHARDSGLAADARLDGPDAAARLLTMRDRLALSGGEVIANPIPEAAAIAPDTLSDWIDRALTDAARDGIQGKAVTPYLLARLAELSGGRSVTANRALVLDNARVAARIARAYAAQRPAG